MTPRGIHKDPDKHRALVFARYLRLKDEPEFRQRQREAEKRYRAKWYKRAGAPKVEDKAA